MPLISSQASFPCASVLDSNLLALLSSHSNDTKSGQCHSDAHLEEFGLKYPDIAYYTALNTTLSHLIFISLIL